MSPPLTTLRFSATRTALCALMVILSAANSLPGPIPAGHGADLTDQGTFEIFSGGKRVGTEDFAIRIHSDHIEARGDEQLQVDQNGKMVAVETISNLVLDADLNPLSYTWMQKGAQTSQLSIDFRAKPAHARYKQITGKEDQHDFKLDSDVVVLDDNVIHHYELAIARYDQAKGGPQVLSGFVPQEAMPGVLILNYAGLDKTTLNGSEVTVRHYALTAGSTQMNLWADEAGHLQLMSTADFQFQARRKQDSDK